MAYRGTARLHVAHFGEVLSIEIGHQSPHRLASLGIEPMSFLPNLG
jgi:hypothetical protein